MNDIVIEMLKYGKDNLSLGVTLNDVVTQLNNKGFAPATSQETADAFFNEYFYQNTTNSRFYLNPKGYFDLLQIENTIESRSQANKATIIAIISIIVAIVAIFIQIFSTSGTVNLKSNPQIDSIIAYQRLNQQILSRIEVKLDSNNISAKLDSIINQEQAINKHLNCIRANVITIKDYLKPKTKVSVK